MHRLLDNYGAADLLDSTVRRVNRMVNAGQIPHVLLPDGEIRFDGDDLREWVGELKLPAVAEVDQPIAAGQGM